MSWVICTVKTFSRIRHCSHAARSCQRLASQHLRGVANFAAALCDRAERDCQQDCKPFSVPHASCRSQWGYDGTWRRRSQCLLEVKKSMHVRLHLFTDPALLPVIAALVLLSLPLRAFEYREHTRLAFIQLGKIDSP